MAVKCFMIRQNVLYKTELGSGVKAYLKTGDIVEVFEPDEPNAKYLGAWWYNRSGYVRADMVELLIPVFEDFHSSIKIPTDQEIGDAWNEGRNAAQYISLKALGYTRKVNYNLCGEFCVAALAKLNVIPALGEWLNSYRTIANNILRYDRTTGFGDLQTMLESLGMVGTIKSFDSKNYPSPAKLKEVLPAIVGCGIDSAGRISSTGRIRHWIVATDVLNEYNSGWVQVYNPFWNQFEAVRYEELLDSAGRLVCMHVEEE